MSIEATARVYLLYDEATGWRLQWPDEPVAEDAIDVYDENDHPIGGDPEQVWELIHGVWELMNPLLQLGNKALQEATSNDDSQGATDEAGNVRAVRQAQAGPVPCASGGRAGQHGG